MFNFILGRRSLPYVRNFLEFSPFTSSQYFCSLPSLATNSLSNSSNEQSITVSYLIHSCGLSPEKAVSVSRYVSVKSTKKCDSVLAIFKKHGFTKTQISASIAGCPQVLSRDPDKSLLPKLEFLSSIGLSSTDIAKVISASPRLMSCSLESNIIPNYKFFSNLFQSDKKALFAFKRHPMLLGQTQGNPSNNILILREAGVPISNAVALLQRHPRPFISTAATFRRSVEEVKEMGFDPLKKSFVWAVYTLTTMTKSTWDKKMEVFKKWGLSKEEILVAFGKEPSFMNTSEDKIMRLMHLLVNRLGLEPSVIVDYPIVLGYSLEKRLYPRVLVYEVLLEKGLFKNSSLFQFFKYSEDHFLNRISKKYEDEAPGIVKLYMEAK